MSDNTKPCPHCGVEILATAKKCKECKQWVETPQVQSNASVVVIASADIAKAIDIATLVMLVIAVVTMVISFINGMSVLFSAESVWHQICGVLCILIAVVAFAILPICLQLYRISKKLDKKG
jgi:protein-S-isoprenylcysteine O-methyltransferase Ste14